MLKIQATTNGIMSPSGLSRALVGYFGFCLGNANVIRIRARLLSHMFIKIAILLLLISNSPFKLIGPSIII